MKKIFIAGAGGYLGSKMVEYFLKKGYFVTAFDRYFFGDVFEDIKKNRSLHIVRGDIRFLCDEHMVGHDVIINLASISNDPASELNTDLTYAINYLGAVNLAKKAKKLGCNMYIFASSCSVYGKGNEYVTETSELNPVSIYAKSKILAEKELLLLNNSTFSVTVLRFATLYGLSSRRMRFDLIVNVMTLHALKKNKIFILGGGQQWRPLLHIDDCIEACHLVISAANRHFVSGEIFNVGTNKQNFQVSQLAYMFKNIFPHLTIEETPGDSDKRSYRVNFDKIHKSIHFNARKSVEDGILEIKGALESGVIIDDIRTSTVNYYKYLIKADKILRSVKLNDTLF